MPRDICARCVGAAEERQRILEVIGIFRDTFKEHGQPFEHLTVIIDSIRTTE